MMRMGSASECGVNSTPSFSARPSFVDEDRISNALPFSSTARVTPTYVDPAVVDRRTLPPSHLIDGHPESATNQVRQPCPDQKVHAQPAHSLSGSCLRLQLGSIGWPSSLSDQEIRALLPEGPSAHRPSPPAGERHERATRQMR
eukprot:3470781-Pleurochrysis_carterae.AAC.1